LVNNSSIKGLVNYSSIRYLVNNSSIKDFVINSSIKDMVINSSINYLVNNSSIKGFIPFLKNFVDIIIVKPHLIIKFIVINPKLSTFIITSLDYVQF